MANVGLELESDKDRTYKLNMCLGRGSFASVWRAEDMRGHTLSAIKVFELRDALGTIEDLKKAFGREREVLSEIRNLDCPHLVRMLESFEDEDTGLCCIVMTLVEGNSLQERM
jgi:serine/threonine protein kinase